jgi:GNAT superfamily N-acetyltransferase
LSLRHDRGVTLHLTGPGGHLLSDDQSRLDLDRCHAWLASSYWANDRTRERMVRSFAHSRVYGVYTANGEQVGLTRAVTDDATFCWLADVFVDESLRGQGIGTWMVSAVVEQLKALDVTRFILGTRDAHGVYAKVGFEPPSVPEIYMELDLRQNRPTRDNVDPSVLRS